MSDMSVYRHWDKVDDLELCRMFICAILYEAYDRDDQEQVEEYRAKLADIDNEIKTLIEQA